MFYHIPHVARWAVDVRSWGIQRESRECRFLLGLLPDEDRELIFHMAWDEAKRRVLKELLIRRMAEVLTQGMWKRVRWKHDEETDRDFLVEREQYVWTGKKYVNSNLRFPNFNFSVVDVGNFVLLVSHPHALTGVYAMEVQTRDPRVEFAERYARLRTATVQDLTEPVPPDVRPVEILERVLGEEPRAMTVPAKGKRNEKGRVKGKGKAGKTGKFKGKGKGVSGRGQMVEAALDPPRDGNGNETRREVNHEQQQQQRPLQQPRQRNLEQALEHPDTQETEQQMRQEGARGKLEKSQVLDETTLFGDEELLALCEPQNVMERYWRRCLSLTGKSAYFKTLGKGRGRCWSSVVLGHDVVGCNVPGGNLDPDEVADKIDGPRRHPLYLCGALQRQWRCEVHRFLEYCVVVCRGPPAEANDPEGEFTRTLADRFPEIDSYDQVLEHTEPAFIQVPLRFLLPEKYQTDYVRACGGGERGEQLRMNR